MQESTGAQHRVVFFSREDCCLCDEALEEVQRAREAVSFALEIVDVSTDPALEDRYGQEVPVIEIDGRKAFKFKVTRAALLKKLRRPRWKRGILAP